MPSPPKAPQPLRAALGPGPGAWSRAGGRRRAAAALAAAAFAAALLGVLAYRHAAGLCSLDAVALPPGTDPAAEAWLLRYYQQRRVAAHRPPAWADGIELPPCAAPAEQQQVQQQALHRHLVLATVGDDWGPGADRNRRARTGAGWVGGQSRRLACLNRPAAPRPAGGWTSRAPPASTWWSPTTAAGPLPAHSAWPPSAGAGPSARWLQAALLRACTPLAAGGTLHADACMTAFPAAAGRYQVLAHVLGTPEWAALAAAHRWSYVWLPDGDLMASTCDITRFLHLAEQQHLVLAQVGGWLLLLARGWALRQVGGGTGRPALPAALPHARPRRQPLLQMSVCEVKGSAVLWEHLQQRRGNGLRYTAFVGAACWLGQGTAAGAAAAASGPCQPVLCLPAHAEIMAAAFRFDFFAAVVRPTLADSFTGWGLDVRAACC